ncbi:MAG: T9SS type A sorting domain-containing protein [Candidatus Cloacimonadota bacterium]|nr:MAG: T9SS type A sorting domain-containing protein [Candidatus Cloacimonadota bacterium]
MHKVFIIFLIILVCLSQVLGHPSHIPVTRLISPDNSKPMSYREWREETSEPLLVSIGNVGVVDRDGGKINVIVNSLLYPKLTFFLEPTSGQFVSDLTNDGWTVSVDTMAMSSDPFAPETLRSFLIDEYNTGSVGAILVGDLPVAWFQMMDVFWGSTPSYTDFPIDLFYMDLDGIWLDQYEESGGNLIPGSDSIYDTHTGNMEPEIFIGRLISSTVGDDSIMLHNYFQRNHSYRVDSMNLSKEALFYIDDDWAYLSGLWAGQLGTVYDSIFVVDDPETTIADDYRTRITVSHEWVSLFAHSWPQGHCFKYNSGGSWSWFYSYEIPTINPIGNFYNLFACSNARYTESDYCGGMYTFRTSYGLGSLGSTKTGSMLEFQYFYNPISLGYCLGDAFRDWFSIMAEAWGDTSRSWFYGMTLIGDPTLTVIDSLTAVAEAPDEKKNVGNLLIFPNPASHYVIFQLGNNKIESVEFTIYGVDGRVVLREKRECSSILRLDCSKIPAGIYFCSLKTPEKRLLEKLTILR